LISRSTADAISLVFFSSPKAPADCAFEIARAAKSEPDLRLRMGINSGPVYRVKDLNQVGSATGSGISIAQQIVDCGDSGHILASQTAAEVLGELHEWSQRFHDIGVHKLNGGASVHLFNLYDGGTGNPALPRKLRKKRPYTMLLA